MNNDIIENINKFLSLQKIKKVDLAELIGMNPATLISQLNGTRYLSIDVLCKIFEQYPDLNMEWVLTGKGVMLYSELTSKCSSKVLAVRVHELESQNKNLQTEITKRDAQIELLQKMVMQK